LLLLYFALRLLLLLLVLVLLLVLLLLLLILLLLSLVFLRVRVLVLVIWLVGSFLSGVGFFVKHRERQREKILQSTVRDRQKPQGFWFREQKSQPFSS